MRINTNMNAMTALNQMSKNVSMSGTAMNKISSGERINKAGDDAAGMAISEKMRSQIRGLDQASRNTQDGISVIQTAEGAMEEIGNIAQRMRELSVQSSNETNSAEDRSKIAEELTQLHSEIDRIADSTQFNGKNLLNGAEKVGEKMTAKMEAAGANYEIKGLDDLIALKDGDVTLKTEEGTATGTKITLTIGGKKFELDNSSTGAKADKLNAGKYTLKDTTAGSTDTLQIVIKKDMTAAAADTKIATNKKVDVEGKNLQLQVGANTTDDQQLKVKIENVNTESLGLTKSGIDDMKAEGATGTTAAKAMIDSLDKALESVNTSRANLGAMQNRLETAQSNLTTSSENLTAAESRIRDVDVAKEMMNLSKLNLLTQASQAMMGQAKQQPEGVMQLLR